MKPMTLNRSIAGTFRVVEVGFGARDAFSGGNNKVFTVYSEGNVSEIGVSPSEMP